MAKREGFLKTITVNGKKRPLYTQDHLQKEFNEVLKQEGNSAFHANGFLRVSYMRTKYSKLFAHITTAAYQTYGVLNSSLLFNDWGFYTMGKLSPEQAENFLKEHVFTKSAVENAYQQGNQLALLGAARKHINPFVRRSYNLFTHKRRAGFDKGIRSLANTFYPELEVKYGRKLYLEELTEQEIIANLGQRFVEERNVLHRRDPDPLALHVDQSIRSRDIPGEIPFNIITKNNNKTYFGSISSRQLIYLKKNPGLERLQLKDIAPRIQEGRSLIGQLAEYETQLFFYLLRDNPDLVAMSGLQKYLGDTIKKVYTNNNRKKVTLYSGFAGQVESDIRLETTNGKGKAILIDTKRYDELPKKDLETIIQHYAPATEFLDGTAISKKFILFNSETKKENEIISTLRENGIGVIPGNVFDKAYKKALEFLPEDFFMQTTMPLAGTFVQQIKKLQGIHELVFQKPYLLSRNGNDYYLNWALKLYSSILDTFTHPNKLILDREKFLKLPSTRIINFREIEGKYAAFDKAYLENLVKFASDVLFFDLETAGVVRSGNPLHTIGLAYVKNGIPIIHQLFARDPAEERLLLQEFSKIANSKSKLVDFNGSSFDQPFMEERFYAHCMPYTFREKHLDLLPYWRAFKHLLPKKIPNGRLQLYEQISLDAHLRMGDIPGEKIAEAWKAAIEGGPTGKLWKIIKHNLYDMKTLAALYVDLIRIGALTNKLPKDFSLDDFVQPYGSTNDLPF